MVNGETQCDHITHYGVLTKPIRRGRSIANTMEATVLADILPHPSTTHPMAVETIDRGRTIHMSYATHPMLVQRHGHEESSPKLECTVQQPMTYS